MKVALIGYGYWGRNIARTLKELNIKIETIFDEDKKQIKEAEKLYQFNNYNNLEDVLKNSDLVFIEIQTGDYFGEDDIERLEDDFNREK